MTNTKRTRFKLTVANNAVFMILAVVAMILEMEQVTLACITQIGIVTSFYHAGESYNKSSQH